MSLVPHKFSAAEITFNDKSTKKLVEVGEKSLKHNRFFQFMDILMNDDNLRGFIDDFFSDWDDVKTSILMMKTYQLIDMEIKNVEQTGTLQIEPSNRRKLIIGLVKEMMTNSECRQELVRNMNQFMGMDHLNCRKLIEQRVPELHNENKA